MDKWFHWVLALCAEESLVVHEMKCNGAAGAIADVGGRAVPGERVMIVNVAGRDWAGFNLDFVIAEFLRHRIKGEERLQKIDVIAPVVRALNHLHAAVGLVGIVEGDPGGDLLAAGKDGPIGSILVPHVHAAGAGGFVLDLIVEEAELFGFGELGDFFGDGLVGDHCRERPAGLPDVDDLPDGIFL